MHRVGGARRRLRHREQTVHRARLVGIGGRSNRDLGRIVVEYVNGRGIIGARRRR